MKREIISLKRKLNGSESRVRCLEADSTQLRAQIATLMNRDSGGSGETVPITAMYDGLNAAVALDPSIDGVAEIAMVEGAINVANEDAIDEQCLRRLVDAGDGIQPPANVAQNMGTTDTGTVPTILSPIVASCKNPQFGITQATLLAPRPPAS